MAYQRDFRNAATLQLRLPLMATGHANATTHHVHCMVHIIFSYYVHCFKLNLFQHLLFNYIILSFKRP